jgi:hypothetical protein
VVQGPGRNIYSGEECELFLVATKAIMMVFTSDSAWLVPSGYVKIAMENHHFYWENPL